MTVREDKFDFRARERRRRRAGLRRRPGQPTRLVLRLGADLLRFRSVITAAEQVKEVEVRGWDVAPEAQDRQLGPGRARKVLSCRREAGRHGQDIRRPDYVATDVRLPHPVRGRHRRNGAGRRDRRCVRRDRRGRAGKPEAAGQRGIKIDNAGEPFDGKYTITTARHRYEPTNGGYTTAFSVTGRQERSLYGLTAGGSRAAAGAGVVIAQVSDANDPQQAGPGEADLPVAVRRLRQRLGPHRAARRRQGPRRDGASPRSATRCWCLRAGRPQRPYVLGGLYNGIDKPSTKGPTTRRRGLRRRQPPLVRLAQRAPDRPARRGRQDGGDHRRNRRRQAEDLPGLGRHRVTVHSDGTVLIEGKKGIVVDAATSDLALKGEDLHHRNQWCFDVRRFGAVDVDSQTALSLKGTTVKVTANAAASSRPAVPTSSPAHRSRSIEGS